MFAEIIGCYDSIYHKAWLKSKDLDKIFWIRIWMNLTLKNYDNWVNKENWKNFIPGRGKDMTECPSDEGSINYLRNSEHRQEECRVDNELKTVLEIIEEIKWARVKLCILWILVKMTLFILYQWKASKILRQWASGDIFISTVYMILQLQLFEHSKSAFRKKLKKNVSLSVEMR